jgi:hypothetical protein
MLFIKSTTDQISLNSTTPYLKDVAITTSDSLLLEKKNLSSSQLTFDWSTNRNPFQRLKNLLFLEENWDGYGAPQFSRTQVYRAFDLYSNVYSYYLSKGISFSEHSPFIAPGSDGTVLFEWAGRRFPRRTLEIFVPSDSSIPLEYFQNEAGSEGEGLFFIDEIDGLLDWLFASDS